MSKNKNNREVLFSVTAADCDWEYMRGTGPGGQKRNKTSSKVRCTHRDSGAWGESDETRSQHDNKRLAFRKMAETKEFKAWHKMECARRMGQLTDLKETVDNAMKSANIRIEGGSNLSKDEIERMRQEAEANADSDKKEKERIILKIDLDIKMINNFNFIIIIIGVKIKPILCCNLSLLAFFKTYGYC